MTKCTVALSLSPACLFMQNDSITIHHRFAGDYRVKLSISHALSQSTKLCVFEERVLEIVQTTKDLPEALATSGADCLPASIFEVFARQSSLEKRIPSPALANIP